MRILILEDEMRAAFRLVKMLQNLRPEAEVEEPLESIADAEQWFQHHADPDILIMDIELADGPSFELFSKVNTRAAIIFVTAFDQYALEAFRHHGLAYILKPVKEEELNDALTRAESMSKPGLDYSELVQLLRPEHKSYQDRILVKIGQRYKAIPVEEIAYIHTEDKSVKAVTTGDRDIPLDQTLEQLEEMLDPARFFRINRKIIVSHQAIDTMFAYSRSRMKLELLPERGVEAIVATDRSGNFKNWLEGR